LKVRFRRARLEEAAGRAKARPNTTHSSDRWRLELASVAPLRFAGHSRLCRCDAG
jgi:hypothetical protein